MQDFVQNNYHTYLLEEMLSIYQIYRKEALGMHCLIPPPPHTTHSTCSAHPSQLT